MFNKRLLASITLDKKKLEKNIKGSCIIECIPSINTLNKSEKEELKKSLNIACELLRTSYIRCISEGK